MGVQGLWELLAPVGRRVSVETLAGKKLAIDASIWMIQFMKAMRDDKGEMVRNAHILGFFRRICKLLYLRTKPVFVFDGGTPALKRRTVIARRRQRENAQAKIRKTAEKLLLNHLKAMRLKELAEDLERQRQENDIKGKKPIIEEKNHEQNTDSVDDDVAKSYDQETFDAMLAASLAVEENEGFSVDASTSGSGAPHDQVLRDGEDEEEDDDDDEEMILPEMHGQIDPAVLAALPPSMQLDLLVQMRERLMAENRQKYQKVKKVPARFSELQIQAYLKTVAFRREIDGVQKSAAGRGIDGVQTSRIASEANREFIFSSSFTGDKQALTSVGQERGLVDQSQPVSLNSTTNAVNGVQPNRKSGSASGSTDAEAEKAFHDDVETYLDERGRLRVSRVRALGIRMTRDLQRNLDLMKERDQEKAEATHEENNYTSSARNSVDVLDYSSDRTQRRDIIDKNTGMDDKVDKTKGPEVLLNGTSIEISFEDTCDNEYGKDDDSIFADLVAGAPVLDFSVDNSAKQSLQSASDCEWEEGGIEDKRTGDMVEGAVSDGEDVEWEDGEFEAKSTSLPDRTQKSFKKGDLQEEVDFQEAIRRSLEEEGGFEASLSSDPDESQKTVANGDMQEEADFQEAIRRSLAEASGHGLMNQPREDHIPGASAEMISEEGDMETANEGNELPEVDASSVDASKPLGTKNLLEADLTEAKSAAFVEVNPHKSNFDSKTLSKDDGENQALSGPNLMDSTDALSGEKRPCTIEKQQVESFNGCSNEHAEIELMGTCHGEVARNSSNSAVSASVTNSVGLCNSGVADAGGMFQVATNDHPCETATPGNISSDDPVIGIDGADELVKKIYGNSPIEKEELMGNSFMDVNKDQEIMKDHLDEEIQLLGKEREELGSEQRKLERNAESVSSEMFAECQELLQMFGLPYIIAPMEAEAQCAFMEMSNLVDGVVTDDSDAFLFGARSVYKNIFDDRKYVETYLMKDIENELGLDREKLIHMALLLGSDYTEGVSGIGIVNAIEVVNAFPEKDGLREFREWIESPDPTILGKVDLEAGSSRNKGSKHSGGPIEGVTESLDDAERIKQIFMNKHRNVSKNWHIPSSFPSDGVISAYASPQVDKSTEPFAWGKPDLYVLRRLCLEKFGWGTSKADELLLPVLKEYNKHETQLRLEAFYTFNERFAKIRSKRIKKAVKGITGSKSSHLMDETMPQQSGGRKKRKVNPIEDEANQSGANAGMVNEDNTVEKHTVKRSRRGRGKTNASHRNLEQSTGVDRKESDARGRRRGRGRGQPSGRGKRKKNSSPVTETSDDNSSSAESENEMQFDKSEESQEVRRSERQRKIVNYAVGDEYDNFDKDTEDIPDDEQTDDVNKFDEKKLDDSEDIKMNQMETSQIADPINQSQLQEDYLQFGGGFCMDEDEEVHGNASSPATEMKVENSDVNVADPVVGGSDESDPLVITPRSSNEKTDLPDTAELYTEDDDSGNRYNNSLRAMPNLRRKKKKI